MLLHKINNDLNREYPRCKNHGTFSSLSQVEEFLNNHQVSSEVFSDLMIGDNFILQTGGGSYRVHIAGFDTEYDKGDTALATHHITCIANFGSSKMNSTDTTAGGYAGASVMQSFLDTKATDLRNICGSHLLQRRALLTNTVTSGRSSGWVWQSRKLTLMSETQVYGSIQWANGFDTGEGYEKLPIFNELTPLQLFGRTTIWLRGVYSTAAFCNCYHCSYPDYTGASASYATVAVFCLG